MYCFFSVCEIFQKYFFYRLAKARNAIECSLGIMCSKWQILERKLCFKLDTSITIVKAIACLHIFRITRRLEREEDVDNEIPPEILQARGKFSIKKSLTSLVRN